MLRHEIFHGFSSLEYRHSNLRTSTRYATPAPQKRLLLRKRPHTHVNKTDALSKGHPLLQRAKSLARENKQVPISFKKVDLYRIRGL